MREKDWMICLILGLFFLPSIGMGVESTPEGSRIISHGSEDRIYAVQCGLDATLFVLEYFHIEYPLDKVSLGLPFNEKGTSLSDIQGMLSSFGLETRGRKGVTLRQLEKALDPDTLAVVPLQVDSGNSHYYVAAMDDRRRPVIVDPPRKAAALSDGINQVRLDKAGGVVLFVRRKKESQKPLSEYVQASPKSIELGELRTDGPSNTQLLHAKLSLVNKSDQPIMVSRIVQSCGCTELDWKGGLLYPKKKREIRFMVHAGSWGSGLSEKEVLFTFGDGSTRRIVIRGVGIRSEEKHRIELAQRSIRIDLTDRLREKTVDVHVTGVRIYGPTFKALVVDSEADWLSPSIVTIDEKTGELRAKINTTRAIALLKNSSNRIEGGLTLSTKSDLEPARVTVEVIRRDFFHVEPGFLRIAADDSDTYTLLTVANNQETEITAIEVKSVPSGLKVEILNKPGKAGLTVRVGETGKVSSGFQDIIFTVESSNGVHGTARVPVHLISLKH